MATSCRTHPMETSSLPHDQRTLRLDKAIAVPAEAPQGALALALGTRLDEFEITGLVGEGGFGIVYRAFDAALDRDVAIKEYLPASLATRAPSSSFVIAAPENAEIFQEGLKSFVGEARLLAKFDHPSLVKVYRFWEDNGTAYMVMPLYVGPTLKDKVLQGADTVQESWLRPLFESLLDALEVLHRSNCLHRDVAPDNIIIVDGMRPVLLDFGAARRVISDRTQTLTVILKPGFAPVEQYAEVPSLKQGPWTDLYALAAVMYWTITGIAPPPSVARLMLDKLVPLQRVAEGRYGPAFLQALDRALALKPEDRPQNVSAFRALLKRVPEAKELSLEAEEPGAAPALLPEGRLVVGPLPRWVVLGAVFACATLVLMGISILLF